MGIDGCVLFARQTDAGADYETGPLYQILFQWNSNVGLKETENERIDGKLLWAIRQSGFISKSYALTYWSSDSHGWEVFEGHDLEAFEKTVRSLKEHDDLDRFFTTRFTIGRFYFSNVHAILQLEGKNEEAISPTAPPEVEAGSTFDLKLQFTELRKEEGVYGFFPISESDPPHEFHPVVINTPNGVTLDPKNAVKTSTSIALPCQTNQEARGMLQVFVGIDDPEKGGRVAVNIVAPAQEGEQE